MDNVKCIRCGKDMKRATSVFDYVCECGCNLTQYKEGNGLWISTKNTENEG